jgi:hypothetical protein
VTVSVAPVSTVNQNGPMPLIVAREEDVRRARPADESRSAGDRLERRQTNSTTAEPVCLIETTDRLPSAGL